MTLLSTVAALFLLFQASATGTINGSVNGPGTPINLMAGSTVQDGTIRLTPTGTGSGRILDELGQPAVEGPVQLVGVAVSPQGKKFQPVGSPNVNDRGEYRL